MHCPFPRFSQPSYAKAPERSELKTTGSNLSVRFSQYRQETRSSLGKQQLFLLSSTDGPLRPADPRPARSEKITCAAAWFTDLQCFRNSKNDRIRSSSIPDTCQLQTNAWSVSPSFSLTDKKKWKTAGKKLAAADKILSHDGISSSVTAEMFESAAKTPQNSVCN